MRPLPPTITAALSAILLLASASAAEESVDAAKAGPETESEVSPELKAAIEKLQLPGVTINLEEWCVDVECQVCLRHGLLELIACTKGTKEHESIIMVEAKPSHIHTALLLIGARPGNPAMRKPIDEEGMRFIDLPPRGGPVDVLLVLDGGKEKPISEFIVRAEDAGEYGPEPEDDGDGKFPTHTFLFAGSILFGGDEGPRRYICDESGNVISLSTFGDEVLCLPGIHGHANGMLMWEVAGDELPKVGEKVALRLRPQVKRPGVGESGAKEPGGGKPGE